MGKEGTCGERSRTMKIAFLNITQGLVNRGAETFVKEVAERLVRNGEVKIISGTKIPLNRWSFFWRLFIDPNGISVLLFTLKNLPLIWREKFDVVVPLNGGWQPFLVRLATWLYGGKMVISGQSGIGWDDFVNLWSFPDCFVAISSYAKERSKKINPFLTIKYIPNGVDLKKFGPTGEKLKVGLKKPVILFVGALEPGKRVIYTIRAVHKVAEANLLIVGDGVLKKKVEKLCQKLLPGRFEIKKFSHNEMPKVYRAADLFTLVSKPYHSFEIALVEAMATNLPVVANEDPIRKEIVGESGILVNPKNVEEYAASLKKALSLDWGTKPRKQAGKFSWDKIAGQYEKLFRR